MKRTIDELSAALEQVVVRADGFAQVEGSELADDLGYRLKMSHVSGDDGYATLTIDIAADDDVTITVGRAGHAEYHDLDVAELVAETTWLAEAVVAGNVSETFAQAPSGNVLLCHVRLTANGRVHHFRYRRGFRLIRRAKRVRVDYRNYRAPQPEP